MIYIFGGAFDPPHVGHTSIVKAILHYKNPEKIVIIPSSARNDKKYSVSDEHRLAMLRIFVQEIDDDRVTIDDYFIQYWTWEMITRDVDAYCHQKYGKDIIHIFGTDTMSSMPKWDSDGYAAKVVRKIFVPRRGVTHTGTQKNQNNFSEKYSTVWLSTVTVTEDILNFEFFSDSHIPDISSTELRKIIPKYTDLKAYYEEEPKFIIPWLSKRVSQYILEKRLYRANTHSDTSTIGNGDVSEIRRDSNVSSVTVCASQKPKVLIHVCCGPDVTMPILALRDEYDVICFWYDPNIQPKSEYDKRYEAFVKVCDIEGVPYIKWAYDVKNFFTRIKGVEHTPERGEKCTYCYDMRMMVTAKLAHRLKILYYTSSLNTSPKKDLEKLFRMWHTYAEKYGITFLDIPFRKKWGFEKSVEYTREHDIFRQNYCGCIYSIREGGGSEMKGRMVG